MHLRSSVSFCSLRNTKSRKKSCLQQPHTNIRRESTQALQSAHCCAHGGSCVVASTCGPCSSLPSPADAARNQTHSRAHILLAHRAAPRYAISDCAKSRPCHLQAKEHLEAKRQHVENSRDPTRKHPPFLNISVHLMSSYAMRSASLTSMGPFTVAETSLTVSPAPVNHSSHAPLFLHKQALST